MCSKNILKSCDYITLDINDAIGYTRGGAVDIDTLTWNIPRGVYRTVIKQPQITTVQVTAGSARINATTKSAKIEYVNSTMNQYTTRGSSVIGYGNKVSEPDSVLFVGNGEFIVGDRPEQIKLKITATDRTLTLIGLELLGFVITLKFSYYDAKE